MAWIIEKLQRPALVIAHNKTLAAQLCNEFREFFPHNSVEYFVSYYDYYQPEAYVPQADLYIEKDSSRNDDIDRLRHAATSNLLARRDTDRRRLGQLHLRPRVADGVRAEDRLPERRRGAGPRPHAAQADRHPVRPQRHAARPRPVPRQGRRRSRCSPRTARRRTASSFFGDEVEAITHFDPLTGEVLSRLDKITVFPATQYVTSKPTIERAVVEIQARARRSR